ncbi:Cellulose synthase operon protein C [Candidatus Hydrogenisulfobacillus filiaventi]|uniref:Cellulose synthase operon protein C n=1 Tax=Candidatus Hydrogenisulfobacillus filiaventi TaxID=2707344 RepID=A0A6F8ZEK5_9FIRM|nr:Cellulose synthase operon protein C [Candidatus Hydrogenisulfobacillus filiaventi]
MNCWNPTGLPSCWPGWRSSRCWPPPAPGRATAWCAGASGWPPAPADSRGWRRAKARAWGLLARLAHQEGDTTRTREYLLQALRCYTDGPGAWGLQIAAAAVRHAAGDPAAAPDLWALAARMPAAPPLLADADTALERRPFWPSWWTPADGEEA